MKVIDFRFRPNNKATLEGLANSCIFREGLIKAGVDLDAFLASAQDMDAITAQLKQDNVAKAVIVGRDAETTYGFMPNDEDVADFVSFAPDLFVGFAGLDPHKGSKSVAKLIDLVENKGFTGAALDPIYAQSALNNACYYPIYAACERMGLPIVITSGPARYTPKTVMDYANPGYIDQVAADFPDLKIIVSHGGWPFIEEMMGVAFRNKNVYFEASEYEMFPGSDNLVKAGATILQDQMLFASAHPFVNYRDAIKLYETLPFSDEVREKIMWKNAATVLGL